MKYIITENKINNIMFLYLQKYYPTLAVENPLRIVRHASHANSKYGSSMHDYVKKEYYENLSGNRTWENEIKDKWLDKSPLLDFTGNEFRGKMNDMFGEYWKPVFEQWFRDSYPEFPVKTFVYN